MAFLRSEFQFFNLRLVEQPLRRSSAHSPGADFADTVLRNFLVNSWLKQIWQAMAGSSSGALAAIAGQAVKEARYQQQHNADWAVRLRDGNEESARRMAAALQRAWPFVAEMFAHDAVDDAAVAQGLGPARRWPRLLQPQQARLLSRLQQPHQGRHLRHLRQLRQPLQASRPRSARGKSWLRCPTLKFPSSACAISASCVTCNAQATAPWWC